MPRPALIVAAGVTAAALLVGPTTAHAAPVTKADLPTKAEIRDLKLGGVVQEFFTAKADPLYEDGKSCTDKGPVVPSTGRSMAWLSGPDLSDPDTFGTPHSTDPEVAMKAAVRKMTFFQVSVNRTRTVKAAKNYFGTPRELRKMVRTCRTLRQDGMVLRMKPSATPRGGQQRFGVSLSGRVSLEGVGTVRVRGHMSLYRKGARILTVQTLGFGKSPRAAQHKRSVKLALRKAF